MAAQETVLYLPGVRLQLISCAEVSNPDLGGTCHVLPVAETRIHQGEVCEETELTRLPRIELKQLHSGLEQ